MTTSQSRKVPVALGWNGTELLMPWSDNGSFCATVPASTLTASAPVPLGRTLGRQDDIAVAAANDQYLAAWFELDDGATTVRASRIDAAGNYLDGGGIVLGQASLAGRYDRGPSISIGSDGVDWLVVWATGTAYGRRVSHDGRPLGAQPFMIGGAYEAAVRWNGSKYVVLSSSDSLFGTAIDRDGIVIPTSTLIAAPPPVQTSTSSTWTFYQSPTLTAGGGGQLLALFIRQDGACYAGTPGGCAQGYALQGLRIDPSGAAADPAPFEIAKNVWPYIAANTDGSRVLAAWSQYDAQDSAAIFGVLLPADAPDRAATPFRIASKAMLPSIAFDGRDFVVAWRGASGNGIGRARVTQAGIVNDAALLPLDNGEQADGAAVAASAEMPAIVAFRDRRVDYDDVWRGMFLFAGEWTPAGGAPAPPSLVSALRVDKDTVAIRWQPAAGALGTAVELQLADGAYRPIAVAPAAATSATISLPGIDGPAIRLRAWNAAGLSDPSRTLSISPPRPRAVRH